MLYTRLEIRLLRRGWSRGTLFSGPVGGKACGAVIDPATGTVTHTLVPRARRRTPAVDPARALGDERSPVASDLVRLVAGTHVRIGAARVGRVTCLWVDRASSALTHALVRPRAGVFSREVERVLPIELIESVGDSGLALSKGAPPLRDLPPYREDAAIAHDVRLALAAAIPDVQARKVIKVRVEDAHVTVVGNVETGETVDAAQRAVESVPGVRGLTLDLVSLETLADRVEQQITRVLAEQQITGAQVRVLTEHAIVYLEGHAPSMEARAVIERAALAAAGARVVVNDIAVGGETPSRATETGPLVRNR